MHYHSPGFNLDYHEELFLRSRFPLLYFVFNKRFSLLYLALNTDLVTVFGFK